jgi:hypothetical protein
MFFVFRFQQNAAQNIRQKLFEKPHTLVQIQAMLCWGYHCAKEAKREKKPIPSEYANVIKLRQNAIASATESTG